MQEEISIEEAWQNFSPEWVVLVVSKDKENKLEKANIMPAGWCMRCSFDPPLIAVSIGKSRYTHELLEKSEEFVIAVPNKELIEIVKFTGSCSGRDVDKFREAKIEVEKASKVSLPLIKKATLNFECKKYRSFKAGDHTIFLGKILAAHKRKGKGILLNWKQEKGFEEF